MSESLSVALSDIDLTLGSDAGPKFSKINLEVPQGEILAIVGPSGSGKTSMIMIIAGSEVASAGEISSVMGKSLTHMNEDQLARFRRDHMGIVFQKFSPAFQYDSTWKMSLYLWSLPISPMPWRAHGKPSMM